MRCLFCVFLLMACLTTAFTAAVAEEIVIEVPVHANGASLAEARDAALAQGQRDAYRQYLTMIAADAPPPAKNALSDTQLSALVRKVDVTEEKPTATSYRAKVRYTFSSEAQNPPGADSAINLAELGKALLMLPVFDDGKKLSLWESPNPWRSVWSTAVLVSREAQAVMPSGDLKDTATVDAASASSVSIHRLVPMLKRYAASRVLIAQATMDETQKPLTLTLALRHLTIKEQMQYKAVFTAEENEKAQELMRRVAQEVLDKSQGQGDAFATLGVKEDIYKHITTTAQITTLADWVELRRRLEKVPDIVSVQLLRFSSAEASLHITFSGDPERLVKGLHKEQVWIKKTQTAWLVGME